MIQDIQRLMDAYHLWLKDKSMLRQIDSWVEITTPYLDRHNDYVQIYAKKENNGFLLTDDGYTIDDLEHSGCKLETRKRQDLLKTTINSFGIQLEGHALKVVATPENFALRKHNLLQAILAVNDLFYLASTAVASLFYDDVVNWLDQSDIRYTPKVKFTGKSGYDHLFDFVIPKSRQQPERIIQAITRPSRDTSQAVAFAWLDTKNVRSANSCAYALLNDLGQSVSPTVLEALHNYDVKPVLWSERNKVLHELAA
jgi:hypothetical protein